MTLVYAHRGASKELPENTLPAFRRALDLGADALETDVRLTRDDEIVAVHDPDGARLAGVDRPIAETALSELRAWDAGFGFVDPHGARPFAGRNHRIVTLDEILEEFPGARLNVDLKVPDAALVDRFIAVVRSHRAEARVVGASFQLATLRRLRAAGYHGETSLCRDEFLRSWLLPAFAQRRRRAGDRAQIPTRIFAWPVATARTIRKLHALGLRVDFWTVNDPGEAQRLVLIGADGIMTDDPRSIVPAVRAAGG